MKGKRGFLLGEETLKIVIAVICIIFLVYFLTSLYFANKNKKDLELAKASLNHLVEEINSLEKGEIKEVEIYNPARLKHLEYLRVSWFILSWPLEGYIPNSCSNVGWENCICICKAKIENPKRFVERCDKRGVCLESDFIVEGRNPIEIVNPPLILRIDYENKMISQK